MAQVTVPVNGRSYAITCDDGQEPRIRRLAQYVDAKVGEFVASVGQVGEGRLLLLAALVIADELSDANDALQQERSRPHSADSEPDAAAEVAANGRDGTAKRVEAIAARAETS
jgi:cell division protein ZapA